MFSLESPYRGDSNAYTQYSTIFNLKIVSLIYFMVSETNILTKFRWTICYTFIFYCTSFEKMHGFSINMQ